jgi:hypothetical protein
MQSQDGRRNSAADTHPERPVAIISYDEKPGIQAIATTAPDLPPQIVLKV